MIDTIQIIRRYEDKDRSILEDFFINKLIPQSSTKYFKGYQGSSFRGTFGNWSFILGPTNFKITGSLTTAASGNNIHNCSFDGIQKALIELQEYFCLDLSKASISRIDLGYNLIVQQKVYNYFKSIMCPHHFKQDNRENETLTFIGSSATITFYDKVAQAKACKKLPKAYKNLNVLRYELRLKSSSYKSIGFKKLLVEDLHDESNYDTLVNYWFNSYLQTKKHSKYEVPILKSGKMKDFRNFVLAHFLNTSENQIELHSYLISRFLTPKQRFDIKAEIAKVQKDTVYSDLLEKELRQQLTLAYCRT